MDADITRDQTRERARLLRVRSYDVDLDFTRGQEAFGSVSRIRFDCRQPGATTHADLIATGVREIALNGAPLDPAAVWADGRITLAALADRNELRGFLQPEHADLLAPYAPRYLSEMPGLWRTRDDHMRVRLASALFPYPAVTAGFLASIDEFLAAGAADPGLARILRDHRDAAGRVLRARTA
jgi:hypothetical protein